jgi:uncharacterized low-complexity protein
MIRIVSTVAAAAASLMFVAAVPAAAQNNPYYSATAAGKLKKASFVTRNTIWKCDDTVCVANKAPDRDATVCAMVAQRAGTLTEFSVNGAAFDPAALEKCNGSAR